MYASCLPLAVALRASVAAAAIAAPGTNIWTDPGVDNGGAYGSAGGSGTWTVSGGAMHFTAVSSKVISFVVANFTESLVNGGVYDITVTVANFSASSGCSASLGGGTAISYNISGNGTFTARVTCGATTALGRLVTSPSGCTFDITDISVVRVS